jgi:hypothetical protein
MKTYDQNSKSKINMVPDEYLRTTIAKYSIPDKHIQLVNLQIDHIIKPHIKNWAGQFLLGLDNSGSYAKGTAILDNSDLDLLISLTSSCTYAMKEVYNSLFLYLKNTNYQPRKKRVSIGINYRGLDIDLVPAKRQTQYGNDHSLYNNQKDTWLKTNIYKHISLVARSSRIEEIKIMKIWRNKYFLDFPSFYLELVVLHVLNNQPMGQIANNIWKVLQYLASSFINASFVDPANNSNIISNGLTQQEREKIANYARFSLTAKDWSEIVG